MLITFRSKAASNIIMYGDSAMRLLKMMGGSNAVPGSLPGKDIPKALESLKQNLAVLPAESHPDSGPPENSRPVSLRLRAHPLMQLLAAAAAKGCSVTWDSNQTPH